MANKHRGKIPNLFIVGAPKCGTTSLHYWLSQHPEIFMSKPKEPKYFCKDLDSAKIKKMDHYLALFKNVKDEKNIGESSTNYLYSPVAPNKIYQFNPNAKIIIIIRRPDEFIASLHSNKIRQGREKSKDLKKAIKKDSDYFKRCCFLNYIKNFQKTFPSQQIKIILFDDIKHCPKTTYKSILTFLNVDNKNFSPSIEKKNPNKEIKIKFISNYILPSKNFKKIKTPFQKILPKKTKKKIYFFLKNRSEKIKPRKPLDKNLENYIKNKTKKEIKELSQIVNRDLTTLWGYDKFNT